MSTRTIPLFVLLCLLATHCASAQWVQQGGNCTSLNQTFDCPYYNSDNTSFPFEVRLFNTTTEPRVFMACLQSWDDDLIKVFDYTSSVVHDYMSGNNVDNVTLAMQLPRLSSIDNRRTHVWDVLTCHLVARGVRSLPVPIDPYVHLGTLQTRNAVAVFPFTNRSTAGIDAQIAAVKSYLNGNFPGLEYDQGLTWAAYSTEGVPDGVTDEIWVTLVWPQLPGPGNGSTTITSRTRRMEQPARVAH